MKAIISFWALFFTALQLQRVLNIIGCVGIGIMLLAGGYGLATDARVIAPWFGAAGLWFFIWIGFPALFVQGFVVSIVSNARIHRLLPNLRLKLLCALLLSMLSMTALILAALAPLAVSRPHPPLLVVASYVFVFMTLLTFLTTTRFGFIVFLVVVMLQTDSSLAPWLSSHQTIINQAMPLVAIALWFGFSLWYLRARRIGPSFALAWPEAFSAAFDAARYEFTQLSRDVAERVLLLGQQALPRRFRIKKHPSGLKPQRLFASLSTVVVLVWILPGDGWGLLAAVSPISLVVYVKVLNLYARNTRRLWLHVAGDRRTIFRLVEKMAWRSGGFPLGFILVAHLLALHQSPPVSVDRVCYAALLNIGAIPFAIYLGLATTRGIGIATIIIAGGLAGGMTFAIAKIGATDPAWLAIGITLLLITAVGLRGIAIHRWRYIDWQSFRPLSIAQFTNLRPTTTRVANPWP